MKKIGIFTIARRSSERCPNKMLRNFCGSSLSQIILNKLKDLGPNTFFAAHEPEFKELCNQSNVRFVQRSQRSASIDEPIVEILDFLRNEEFTHFLIINACLPFLKTETIRRFISHCEQNSYKPSFGVVKRNNFYFDSQGKPFNFAVDMKTINTKSAEQLYEFAHALYFYEKEEFFKDGRYWDWNDVTLYEISDHIELIDIDTEEDFRVASKLWESMNS